VKNSSALSKLCIESHAQAVRMQGSDAVVAACVEPTTEPARPLQPSGTGSMSAGSSDARRRQSSMKRMTVERLSAGRLSPPPNMGDYTNELKPFAPRLLETASEPRGKSAQDDSNVDHTGYLSYNGAGRPEVNTFGTLIEPTTPAPLLSAGSLNLLNSLFVPKQPEGVQSATVFGPRSTRKRAHEYFKRYLLTQTVGLRGGSGGNEPVASLPVQTLDEMIADVRNQFENKRKSELSLEDQMAKKKSKGAATEPIEISSDTEDEDMGGTDIKME
jgi:hypothetical protein